jgi:hypothetical protein
MNASDGDPAVSSLLQSGLEVRTRLVLEQGLSRIDARTRSRLNQARQAAVAEAGRPGFAWLNRVLMRPALMMPAGAAAVVALVAVFMLSGHPLTNSVADNPASALDVLDLVTDDDAMNLMEDNDSSFYEWAAAQSDSAATGAGQSGAAQGTGGATT